MSNDTNDRLLETIKETVDRANDLSEIWTNTTVGSVIDSQNACLKNAVESNDLEQARLNMLSLAETCRMIEKEFKNEQ